MSVCASGSVDADQVDSIAEVEFSSCMLLRILAELCITTFYTIRPILLFIYEKVGAVITDDEIMEEQSCRNFGCVSCVGENLPPSGENLAESVW